jgi:hypothetical protein
VLSIAARGRWTGPDGGNGYIAGLALNHNGIAGSIGPFIWNGSIEIWGTNFNITATPPPYRLEFSGVGPSLRFRVLNLTTKEVIRQQTLNHTSFQEGWVGVWVNNEANKPATYEMITDNLFVTGTKP